MNISITRDSLFFYSVCACWCEKQLVAFCITLYQWWTLLILSCLSLWLYLCNGVRLILIRSDSTRPLTAHCSCSTSVRFSHWQWEDTFHIVLGLWFRVRVTLEQDNTHSLFSFFFSLCLMNLGKKHSLMRASLLHFLLVFTHPAHVCICGHLWTLCVPRDLKTASY